MEKKAVAIDISGLYKVYDNGFEAVKGLSLRIEAGDFFALLGPNGAGKSTTIGMLASLVRKSAGKISVFGIDIDRDFSRAKRLIGLVPQEFNFNVFERCFDIVCNQAGFYGVPRALAEERALFYLHKLGLWQKRMVQARALSGGMKRRLMIARAMAHEPKILILDEPTAGVDLEIRHEMWGFLEELNASGTTIVLTTHYLEEAERLCRNVGIINHGEIVYQNSMQALLAELEYEVFIFDIVPCALDMASFSDMQVLRLDEGRLQLTVYRQEKQGLNAFFARLNALGVEVLSMRSKSNRLEELFLRLVGEREGEKA